LAFIFISLTYSSGFNFFSSYSYFSHYNIWNLIPISNKQLSLWLNSKWSNEHSLTLFQINRNTTLLFNIENFQENQSFYYQHSLGQIMFNQIYHQIMQKIWFDWVRSGDRDSKAFIKIFFVFFITWKVISKVKRC
jgi:hypothetical protein